MKYAEVSFRQKSFGKDSFTFEIPENLENRLQIGQIVEVPFRNSVKQGLIIDIFDKKPPFETKPVLRPLTPPLLTEKQLSLAHKITKKYHTAFSRVLALFLPQKLWQSDGLPPAKILIEITTYPENIRGEKQKSILNYLQKNGITEINKLKEETNVNQTIITALLKKGVINKIFADKFSAQKIRLKEIPENYQKHEKAWEKLQKSKKSLLFGSTGGGKSFLIRKLAAEIANQGKQVLILAPEIAITFEMERKAKEFFGSENILIYHSRLTETEKKDAYWKVIKNEVKIILANRSGLFLPFQNLGLVAVEEEHENSYKSDQSPRYHSRDLAEMLAEENNAQFILSSATPALETLYKAKKGEIDLIKLEDKENLPKIHLVDMKDELLKKNSSPLSEKLVQKITEKINKKEKVILFLNRRGLHSAAFCKECGLAQKCPHCRVSLVHHRKNNKDYLFCHHCARIFSLPERCDFCKSTNLGFFGFGTQKIENLIQQKFPQAKVLRADRDTTSKKGSLEFILNDFMENDADILIGTQIIAKAFDNPRVSLVGIILADSSLQIPDFRSEENTFQLLMQVMGRTGRGENQGEVIIQTFMPNSDFILNLVKADYENFYNQQIIERKSLNLPPFSRILKIIIREENQEIAFKKARIIEEKIKKILKKGETVVTAPPLTPYKHGKFTVNVLIYCLNPEQILPLLRLKNAVIDLDPVEVV